MLSSKIQRPIVRLVFYSLLCFVFVAPVLRLCVMSFHGADGYSLANFITLFHDQRTWEAIKNTLIISVTSTIMAAFMGSFLAFVSAYTNIRHKKLLELLILMPFIIPSYIVTLSWSGLLLKQGHINTFVTSLGLAPLDLYSLTGIWVVLGFINIPVVYLSVVHMLRKIPAEMEWASRACGFTIWQTIWRIDLREVWPAIASGSLLAFLAAIDNFAVPAFLGISSGIPVLSTYIYEKAISFGPDAFPMAAALSVLLSCIAIGGTLLESCFVHSRSAMESIKEDFQPRIILNGSRRKILEWGAMGLLSILNFVPLADMILNAFLKNYGLAVTYSNISLRNFSFVFTNTGVLTAVRNSLILALVTCLVCIVIGTVLAFRQVRCHSLAAAIAEKCAALTYALPGIVLALAMIFQWTEPLPGVRPQLYGTIYILLFAYITRYLILQIKSSKTALNAINPELEDAVRASGGSMLSVWRYVLVPLLMRPVLSGSFLIFGLSLTELTLSSILASAGTKTIGLTIFSFQQAGDYSLSAAMSTVVVLLLLGGYMLAWATSLKKKEKNVYELASRTHKTEIRQHASA